VPAYIQVTSWRSAFRNIASDEIIRDQRRTSGRQLEGNS
jgi:hypothetical protein